MMKSYKNSIFLLGLFFIFHMSLATEFHHFLVIISADNKYLDTALNQEYPYFRVVCINTEYSNCELPEAEVINEKMTIVKPSHRFGKMGTLWSIIQAAADEEVIIDLSNNKFFVDEFALSMLNAEYQCSNIWMTSGYLCDFDQVEFFHPQEKKYKNPWRLDSVMVSEPVTYYAWLFKKIRLQSFIEKNNFISHDEAVYILPLLEMADKHCTFLEKSVIGCDFESVEKKSEKTHSIQEYTPLVNRPILPNEKELADLVVFSYNRPMQLYAFLESLERYVKGLGTVTVIYRTSHKDMEKGYEEVKKRFSTVIFTQQNKSLRGADLKSLTLQASFETPNNYLLYAVDDIIVKDYCDISESISYLKKTGAYGFYLRLGDNINYSYIADRPQAQPDLLPLDKNIYAWRFNTSGGDWCCPASIDMTLHAKKDIQNHIASLDFDRPNYFEGAWSNSCGPILGLLGICYRTSKIVNLPLNKVQSDGAKNMSISPYLLLSEFNNGLKIDITSVFQMNNNSAHMAFVPNLTCR